MAFVIETQVMDRCVRALCAKDSAGAYLLPTFAGLPTDTLRARDEIGRRLYTLNVEAVLVNKPELEDNPVQIPGPRQAYRLPARYWYSPAKVVLGTDELIVCIQALRQLRGECAALASSVPWIELDLAIGRLCEHVVARLASERAA